MLIYSHQHRFSTRRKTDKFIDEKKMTLKQILTPDSSADIINQH